MGDEIVDIPIVVIAYNRTYSLMRLLTSLNKSRYDSKNVTLIISIDKSSTNLVFDLATNFQWNYGEKIVIHHEENLGLRRHVLSCGNFLEKYEAIIVLEDDVVVSPVFYSYSKACALKYGANLDVAGISLYNYNINPHTMSLFFPIKNEFDVYLIQYAPSWGQVWLKKQWFEFMRWYDKNSIEFDYQPHLPDLICSWPKNSWLKYHIRYAIEKDKYFVYPYTSLSTNCGDEGEHLNSKTSFYQVPLQIGGKYQYNLPSELNKLITYDSFFENIFILDVYKNEICIDLYGTKNSSFGKRYWLTTKSQKFKIIDNYGLSFRPIEYNVIINNRGNDVFLYDTHYIDKKPKTNRSSILYKYNLQNILILLYDYNLLNLLKDVFKYLVVSVRTIIKKILV